MAEKILVLDPKADESDVVFHSLEDKGFRLEIESNPDKILPLLEDDDCVLIVNDGMEDVDFLTQARAAQPHLPIILILGNRTPEALAKLANVGISQVLEAPIDIDLLIQAISAFIDLDSSDYEEFSKNTTQSIPQVKFLIANSFAINKTIRSLWEFASYSNHLFLSMPQGLIVDDILQELGHWKKSSSPKPFWVEATQLASVDSEAFINSLTHQEPFNPVVGVHGLSALSQDLQTNMLHFLKCDFAKFEKARELLFVYCLESNTFNQGKDFHPELAREINDSLLIWPPLVERSLDIAHIVQKHIDNCSENAAWLKQLKWTPEALNILLNYPWPNNDKELLAFLINLESIPKKELIDGPIIASLINNNNACPPADASPATLKDFLVRHQNQYLSQKSQTSGQSLHDIIQELELKHAPPQIPQSIEELELLYPELVIKEP